MPALRPDRSFLVLLGILAAVGALLLITAEEGVFSTDENQYLSHALAVSRGKVVVPGTEDLPPARGLAYFSPFDPTPRPVPPDLRTPLPFGVSPLHAFLAAPFVGLGWKGPVALNVLGFCLAAAFAFLLARRWATKPATPWVAAIVVLIGSFSVEYAQGLWPHMLSVGLCTGSVWFASRHLDRFGASDAWAAGMLAGLAFGVRLQALLFVGAVGIVLLVLASHRARALAFYCLGLALPVLVCSLVSHASRGTWNPISRGTGYISAGSGGFGYPPLVEWAISLWARVVDYAVYPALPNPGDSYMVKEPFSGATLNGGSFKKAWLQSAPWVALALVSLAMAWRRPFSSTDGRTRTLRALGLVAVVVLIALATRGLMRHDGLAFNQRYLLDLMPLMAVVLAWAIEPLDLRPRAMAIGAALGVGGWLLAYQALPLGLGLVFAMKAPPLVAAALVVGWALALRGRAGAWPAAVLAACLAWATCVHLFDDLAASRNLRARNHERMAALAPVLRDGDALFAFWGEKDAFGPLQLDRDLVIVDSSPDEPETLARLTRALLEKGRRVLVIPRLPGDKLAAMSDGLEVRELGPFEVGEGQPPLRLLQLSPPREARP